MDLFPIEKDHPLPDNLTFIQEDATRTTGFEDDYFDVIHARALFAGVSSPIVKFTMYIPQRCVTGPLSSRRWSGSCDLEVS